MKPIVIVTITIFLVLPLLLSAERLAYRLPENTAPTLYKLYLNPHIENENFTFDGNSSTSFKVLEPTDTIVVHTSNCIDVDEDYTKVICSNGTVRKPVSQDWDSATQLLKLKFESILPVAEYTIEFKWSGIESPDDERIPSGFRRRLVDINGTSEYVLASVFEPRGARSVFPCWDEPGFRAEISLTLDHKTRYTAISNMPIKEKIPLDNEMVRTVFEQSPPMATYHLTIVLGIFGSMSNEHKNMTYYAQPDKLDHLNFLAKVTPLAVAALEDYTGTEFSLPKLDGVHVYDYPGGANEHWGAVTYSDMILQKPGSSNEYDTRLARVIAHELSHQWFGNLVTPKFWDELWLAEGFATYFTYKIMDRVNRKWHAMDLYSTGVKNLVAFNTERGREEKTPITWMPEGPGELLVKFEEVVYQKGAAIIQMLEHMMSDDVFQNGLKKYFSKHKGTSVNIDDMWKCLQEAYDESQPASPLNIKETLDPWLDQPGHPLLNVTRNYETGVVTITQSDAVFTDPSTRWRIPVTFATASNPNFNNTEITHWIEPTMETIEITGIDKDDWIILNVQSKDFYQVVYDRENWKRITAYLATDNYDKIHVVNRAQLIIDLMMSKYGTEENTEKILDLMSYLIREIDPLPWKFAIEFFKGKAGVFKNSPVYEPFRKFMVHLLSNIIDKIGFEGRDDDDEVTRSLRAQLVPLACDLRHKGCQDIGLEKLIKIINKEIEQPSSSNELRKIYQCGLSIANETIWDRAIDDYITDVSYINPFMYLGSVTNRTFVDEYVVRTLTNSSLMELNMFERSLWPLMKGPGENYEVVLDCFLNHTDEINHYFEGEDSRDLREQISDLVDNAKTTNHQEKLTKIINDQGDKIKDPEKLLDSLKTKVESSEKLINSFQSVINRKPYFKEYLEEA